MMRNLLDALRTDTTAAQHIGEEGTNIVWPLRTTERHDQDRVETQDAIVSPMSNRMPRRAFLALLPLAACSRRVPGLSIALVKDATLVWSRGFGVLRAGSNALVDADTVFEAGSVSKTVF